MAADFEAAVQAETHLAHAASDVAHAATDAVSDVLGSEPALLPSHREEHTSLAATVMYDLLYEVESIAIGILSTLALVLCVMSCYCAGAERQNTRPSQPMSPTVVASSRAPLLPARAPRSDVAPAGLCSTPSVAVNKPTASASVAPMGPIPEATASGTSSVAANPTRHTSRARADRTRAARQPLLTPQNTVASSLGIRTARQPPLTPQNTVASSLGMACLPPSHATPTPSECASTTARSSTTVASECCNTAGLNSGRTRMGVHDGDGAFAPARNKSS